MFSGSARSRDTPSGHVGFLVRIADIAATAHESFDLLKLKHGRIFESYSKVLSVEDRVVGWVWSLRDVTQPYLSDITSRLAAIVASDDDAIIGKDLDSIITSWNEGAARIFGYNRCRNERHLDIATNAGLTDPLSDGTPRLLLNPQILHGFPAVGSA